MPYILRALSSLHSANCAEIVAEQEVVYIEVPLLMNLNKILEGEADYTPFITLPSFQRKVENLSSFFLRQSVRQAELLQVIAEQLAIYLIVHGRFSATERSALLLSGGEPPLFPAQGERGRVVPRPVSILAGKAAMSLPELANFLAADPLIDNRIDVDSVHRAHCGHNPQSNVALVLASQSADFRGVSNIT